MQDRRDELAKDLSRKMERAALQLQLCRGRRARQRVLDEITALNRQLYDLAKSR